MNKSQTSKSYNVLLVDDEQHALNALKRSLYKEPYKVFLALNAAEGLEILNHNEIDLVVTDFEMPEKSGIEFLQEVKEAYPETISIMLTGRAGYEEAVRAINDGLVYRYLTKPWENEELKVTLRQALQHKREREEREEFADESY